MKQVKTKAKYESYLNTFYSSETFPIIKDYFDDLKIPDDRLLAMYNASTLGTLKRKKDPIWFDDAFAIWLHED